MSTRKRSITVMPRHGDGGEAAPDPQPYAPMERLGRLLENVAKGALAVVLYGSGTLVVSGVLFYFSWQLGLTALFVLSGLLPLSASLYLLWKMQRRDRPPRLWRYRSREAAILRLAQRLGGRLTPAEVAVHTGLALRDAEATLNELVRRGYADVQVSPSGVLVYHCLPVAGAGDKERAERICS
jgi:hypothetical protein